MRERNAANDQCSDDQKHKQPMVGYRFLDIDKELDDERRLYACIFEERGDGRDQHAHDDGERSGRSNHQERRV